MGSAGRRASRLLTTLEVRRCGHGADRVKSKRSTAPGRAGACGPQGMDAAGSSLGTGGELCAGQVPAAALPARRSGGLAPRQCGQALVAGQAGAVAGASAVVGAERVWRRAARRLGAAAGGRASAERPRPGGGREHAAGEGLHPAPPAHPTSLRMAHFHPSEEMAHFYLFTTRGTAALAVEAQLGIYLPARLERGKLASLAAQHCSGQEDNK